MASNWISDIAWDAKGPYRTYLMDGPGYKKGDKTYVSPAEVSPSNTTDQRLLDWAAGNAAPGQSFTKNRGRWNSRTGQWDRGTNWTNILSTAVGGAIAAPFVLPAVAAIGGGGSAGAATGAGATAAGGSAVAGGAAAGGGGMSLTNALLMGGQSLLSYLNSRQQTTANDKAADAQLQAVREGLALQERMYGQTRSDLAPFTQGGQGAVLKLGQRLGVTPMGTDARTSPDVQMVTLQSPDGTTQAVPAARAQHYLSRGARVV